VTRQRNYAAYRALNRKAIRARARKNYAKNRDAICAKKREQYRKDKQRPRYRQAVVRIPVAGWGYRA
jgi:hypothetical protein